MYNQILLLRFTKRKIEEEYKLFVVGMSTSENGVIIFEL